MKLVDENLAVEEIRTFYADTKKMRISTEQALNAAATSLGFFLDIECRDVVFCKDCKQCYASSTSSTGHRCKGWGTYDTDCECDPDGFCHKGERKNENG